MPDGTGARPVPTSFALVVDETDGVVTATAVELELPEPMDVDDAGSLADGSAAVDALDAVETVESVVGGGISVVAVITFPCATGAGHCVVGGEDFSPGSVVVDDSSGWGSGTAGDAAATSAYASVAAESVAALASIHRPPRTP